MTRPIEDVLESMKLNSEKNAFLWRKENYSYSWILNKYEEYREIVRRDIREGHVVSLKSDFSPQSVALILSLIENNNIIVPISTAVKTIDDFYRIAGVNFETTFDQSTLKIKQVSEEIARNPYYDQLREKNDSGLILFSSGSTGDPKGAVHSFSRVLSKFKFKTRPSKTIAFLLFDHIGGINTLFHILSSGGEIFTVEDRSPESVCELIEQTKLELLPTTPSFLNMILLSESYKKYDLSSLKMVTYGTESMPEYTLKKLAQVLPDVRLKQTYGLSELGIMSSKSKSSDSLWVKLGGEGFETKIVDDILYIKSPYAMLGYLNADDPFDSEGWFNTQDKVLTDGEWVKILGRVSDIINVGGQKVYPAEVESVLMAMPEVQDVTVFSKTNPILGKVVAARFVPSNEEMSLVNLKKAMREFCKSRIENFKIPVHVEIVSGASVNDRFKKIRKE